MDCTNSLEADGSGSRAAVSRCLETPVILVVNAARMSRSAAAMVHGYQTFEPETNIAAVILNNVAQGRHEAKLRQAIEDFCQIPVIGSLPREQTLSIPDRHLGLVPHGETDQLPPAIEACRRLSNGCRSGCHAGDRQERSIDHARRTANGDRSSENGCEASSLGVMRDRAFSFYYPENLEALEEAGAELVFIDFGIGHRFLRSTDCTLAVDFPKCSWMSSRPIICFEENCEKR